MPTKRGKHEPPPPPSMESLERDRLALQSQVYEQKKELRELIGIRGVTAELAARRHELEDTENQLAHLRDEASEIMSDAWQRIRNKEMEVDREIRKRREATDVEIGEARKRATQERAQLEVVVQDAKKVQTQARDLMAEADAVEKGINERWKVLANKEAELHHFEGILNGRHEQIAKLHEAATATARRGEQMIREAEDRISSANDMVAKTEKRVGDLDLREKSLAEKQAELRKAEKALREREVALGWKMAEHTEAQKKTEARERYLDGRIQEMGVVEGRIKAGERRLEAREARALEIEARCREDEARVEAAREEARRILTEIRAAQKDAIGKQEA